MPTLIERLPENTIGAFYVDSHCIDCDICRTTAPEFFTRHDELGLSIVHRQPVTPEEIALAQEAVDSCPADAIGSDGDSITG